jgi:DNA-binding Lrp family transcriptional regulator
MPPSVPLGWILFTSDPAESAVTSQCLLDNRQRWCDPAEYETNLDEAERRIAAVLMASPRAPWRTVASVLGLSERTVVRRPDTVWVDILGGGDELSSILFLDGPQARTSLLLRDLPARLATSASTVRRRLDLLESGHIVRLVCEVDLRLLGIHADALLWIATGPGRLEATGQQLSRHPQVRSAPVRDLTAGDVRG